jgi:hypothetical protein
MANQEHVKILKQGVEAWNSWRGENSEMHPDLSSADFTGVNLAGAKLAGVNLTSANLTSANLIGVDLTGSDLISTDLTGADLVAANLIAADLSIADLTGADLTNAEFVYAGLRWANLTRTELRSTDFAHAIMFSTIFADTDLSEAKGLDSVDHWGPPEISISTLYKSGGDIPEAFLRGCGVPDDFIAFIPSHFGLQQAIQFYSCFISYSTKDQEFARRLYSRMRDEKLRVWFAPEDIKGGQKLHEQLERAIQMHDRLLIVLSEESMQSEWVLSEIRKARDIEINEGRRKLFPIMLVDYPTVKK